MLRAGEMLYYTDGSCVGDANCRVAGWGWVTMTNEYVDATRPGPKTGNGEVLGKQTNQRAELTAISEVLGEILAISRRSRADEAMPLRYVVMSDSMYSINCLTVWAAKWEQNGWINTKKAPVENRDLVESALKRLRECRDDAGLDVVFRWVKGHSNDVGNNEADRLATLAASNAKKRLGGYT